MKINDVLLQKDVNTPQINPKKDKELKTACADFEAIFIQKSLEEMKKSIPKSSLLGNSREEEIYFSMYFEELSKEIANGKGIGIGEQLYNDLSKKIKNINTPE
jgi:flagellar protein FlgJ